MKKTIKYQFAEDTSGKLVNIDSIIKNENHNEKYICLDCKQELIPKTGNIRVHHFSHKNDTYSCSKETYLHELGKKIFFEIYTKCLNENEPFYIFASLFSKYFNYCKYYEIFKSNNCIKNNIDKINLVQYYKYIEFEKYQNSFKPDLTLINNSNDKIFVEIAVTHPCDEEKIKSKNKIIEINIKNEEDIKIILEKNLSEENNLIKFYNFDDFYLPIEPFCNDNKKYNFQIELKSGEKYNIGVLKKDLCKYTYENIDLIAKITPIQIKIPIIPLMPSHNYIQRGPRIENIDLQKSKKKYNNYGSRKRKK
jgi:hypothetical protein